METGYHSMDKHIVLKITQQRKVLKESVPTHLRFKHPDRFRPLAICRTEYVRRVQ